MGDASAQSEMASDALQVLTEQVFANMKFATQPLEDLAKAALRYQQLMEQAAEAGGAFVDALGKVAVTATRARGATSELGNSFQKLVARHVAVVTERQTQARKFSHQFIVPLQKRVKSDNRTFAKMEDDFKSMTKQHKTELKKAGQSTVKAQKQVSKKGRGDDRALEHALDTLMKRSREFEAFNQRCLRSVLIEERRRYCYLIDNYASVFQADFAGSDQPLFDEALALAAKPEELPASSEALIAQNSSNGIIDTSRYSPPPSPRIEPSAITKEVAAKQAKMRENLPPGAPPEGLNLHVPTDDQINPRSRAATGQSFARNPMDSVLQEQFGRVPSTTHRQ